MPLDYARIGAAIALFASDDDRSVGRAMDQIDWLLAQGKSSWAELGAQIAKLGSTRPADDPRRTGNGVSPVATGWTDVGPQTPRGSAGRRPPSQYLLDKQDVELLMENAERITWPVFRDEMLPSFYNQCVEQNRTFSDKQRAMVHEWLDKLGL